MRKKEPKKPKKIPLLGLPEICPDCLADKEVARPRDVDAECIHCCERRCGRHIVTHLVKVHVVSIEWRGLLKK